VLKLYDRWENGNQAGAHALACDDGFLKLEINKDLWPEAVELLGPVWLRVEPGRKISEILDQAMRLELGDGGELEESLYLQDAKLLAYAHDECAKIGRLVNMKADYRSGLLRAAGLYETLLRARLMRLWHSDQLLVDDGGPGLRRSQLDINDHGCVTNSLARLSGAGMITHLRGNRKDGTLLLRSSRNWRPHLIRTKRAGVVVIWRDFDPKTGIIRGPRLGDFCEKRTSPMKPEDLFEFRHKAIHFCLSVPVDVARDAHEMVRANLGAFEGESWAPAGFEIKTDLPLDFDDLCTRCNNGKLLMPPRPAGPRKPRT
jgi:hypothetical protein